MIEKKTDLVLPGQEVGTSEEYLPGFGIYSKDGKLFSSNIGKLEIDSKTHVAKVKVKTSIPKMQSPGIVTLGIVANVTEHVALIDLIPFESKNFRFVPQGATAVLHVSKVKRGFIKNMESEMKIGDIIRTKIIEVSKHTVNLTTDEKNLGVVRAFCSNCRHELLGTGYRLKCPSCGYTETRKTAYDYGSGRIM